MRLATKFNLALISVLLLSLTATAYLAYFVLQKNAKNEVIQHAGMMLETALAVRGYTVGEIRPLLKKQMKEQFLPQSVPAYAATQSFNKLREKHPEYAYKEATLNPTNLRDRATDWESDIIRAFAQDKKRLEIIGTRETPTGPSLYLARPIRIKNKGCLTCHSVASAAPETMLAKYGNVNGFGWTMNEVIGAQIISVPMTLPIQMANKTFLTFMGFLIVIFLLILFVINIMLRKIIINPIINIARMANDVSMGKMDSPEFTINSKDEVAILATSFNRMRRSLQKAMTMLSR